jgi:UDP-3-O-[3-hydroxymyristoyl] glucosamine N-acyltransferase
MITLKEITARIGGELSGEGNTEITGLASVQKARPGDITFILNKGDGSLLSSSQASAVIVPEDIDRTLLFGRNVVLVSNPSVAYASVAEIFDTPPRLKEGISPLASVLPSARISEKAIICPYAFVGEDTVIEEDVVLYPFSYVGNNVKIGAGSVIYPHVTVYDRVTIGRGVIVHAGVVLGSDGFGYIWDGMKHKKIRQLGVLEIGDNVEIGANTCIDRASLDRTAVNEGTKIDNLVQIGHNVTVGAHSILVSQVGIAGSTKLGMGVVLGGKVGVADHVNIGNKVRAAGGTGITKDVDDNATIAGNPHLPHREWLRQQAYLRKLPDLFKKLNRIEEKLQLRDDHDRD